MRRIALFCTVVALAVALTSLIMVLAHNQTQAQIACAGDSPIGSAIHFATVNALNPPKISQAAAIQLAQENAAIPLDNQQVKTVAQYVLFSDDARGTADKIGDDDSVKLAYQNVPAWVVTFCGVNVSPPIPFNLRNQPIAKAALHDWYVVINAETGEYMEEFAFR